MRYTWGWVCHMPSVVELLVRWRLLDSFWSSITSESRFSGDGIIVVVEISARKCRLRISQKLVSLELLLDRVLAFLILIREGVLDELDTAFTDIMLRFSSAGIQCADL